MSLEEGIITSVSYQEGIPVCDVQLLHRINVNVENVPVMRQHHGMFMVPEQDQKVQLINLKDQRFIVGVLAKNESGGNPSLSEGEVAFKFDSGTSITFTKDGSGNYNVSISASGELTIDGAVDVKIDGIDFDEHTHDYSWTDSGGSGTTDPPA